MSVGASTTFASTTFLLTLLSLWPGNTKGGSITVPLTSCLTGLNLSLLQIKTKIVSCHTAHSKPVKQEVNGTVILPPLVFSVRVFESSWQLAETGGEKRVKYVCHIKALKRLYIVRARERERAGNTKGGSITVPLTSCLTGLNLSVLQIKTKIVSCHTADSKPVKQEVNGTVISPFSILWSRVRIQLTFSRNWWRKTS